MWKVIYNLNKEGEFDSFEDAFKHLFEVIKDEETLTLQLLETAVWIESPQNVAIPFYDARDMAYDKGLLNEGKPTWK